MTEKQIQAVGLYEEHGTVKGAARAAGISPAAMRKRLQSAGVLEKGKHMSTASTTPSKAKARSLADFRETYDKDTIIPKKLDAAIAELGEGWLYESEFVKLAGVSYMDLTAFRDAYSAHIVYIKRDSKRVWAGTPEVAEQMRRML